MTSISEPMCEVATGNAEAAKDLLEHLVAQGVDPKRRRLFVIDGSKALRAAWKLGEKEGMAKFRQIAGRLERDYPEFRTRPAARHPAGGGVDNHEPPLSVFN